MHDNGLVSSIDFWVGTFFILVVAAVQIVAFGWIFGVDRGLEEAHQGAQMRIPGVFRFVIKYVAPLFLAIVIGGFCVNDLPTYLDTLFGDTENAADARKTWVLLLATIGLLVAITFVGAKRWRAQGLDLDGRLPAKD